MLRLKTRLSELDAAIAAEELRTCLSDAAVRVPVGSAEDVRALHSTLLGVLMAADSRLGKAYCLGVTLREIATPPPGREVDEWLDGERTARAKRYLADLHTTLPDHAAMGVLGSLLMWADFAAGLAWRDAVTLTEQARARRTLLSQVVGGGSLACSAARALSRWPRAGQEGPGRGGGHVADDEAGAAGGRPGHRRRRRHHAAAPGHSAW